MEEYYFVTTRLTQICTLIYTHVIKTDVRYLFALLILLLFVIGFV